MARRPDLSHVPGDAGLPLLGHTPAFLRDARGLMEARRRRYGDVFRIRVLGRDGAVFLSPEATREIYLDRDQVLSSELGWESSIGPLFRRGLMLRDFEDHHLHRRVMQQAFSRAALRSYTARISEVVERDLAALPPGPVDVYQAMKRLTLDVAIEVFVGADLGRQAAEVNDAFVAMMRASLTLVRRDVPGTPFHRGLVARRRLEAVLGDLVERRRGGDAGDDLLSRLAHATTDAGERLTREEVVDHMAFLLLAAHDTTTATLAVLFWELARHPGWQDRIVSELAGLGGRDVSLEDLPRLPALSWAIDEAMRMSPPVAFSPRVAVADCEVGGVRIPQGSGVAAASIALHRHPDWWSEPDRFDPERFSPERAEHRRHSHLFVPFGGGAHLCIGNHLAQLVMTTVVSRVLTDHRVSAVPGQQVVFRPVPIPKPRGPVLLTLR